MGMGRPKSSAAGRERPAAPWHWLRRVFHGAEPERHAVFQALKMALAAVIAWLITERVHAPQSFIAPYTAVFVISATIYRSVIGLVQQMAAVLSGIGLAFVAVAVLPDPVSALFVSVLAGMLLGRWRRFGDSGVWVGALALIMIASGTADEPAYLLFRVVESGIGVVVGATVNVLVAPPLVSPPPDGRAPVGDVWVSATRCGRRGCVAHGARPLDTALRSCGPHHVTGTPSRPRWRHWPDSAG